MIAIPLGVYKAMHHGSGIDKAMAMLLAIGHAIPVFVFEAIQQRDYPVIFGTLFIFTLVGLLLQLISDLSYHLIDPRIDFEGR